MITQAQFETWIGESDKAALVEILMEDSATAGWDARTAWAAADDIDNWDKMADGTIEARVIATPANYGGTDL